MPHRTKALRIYGVAGRMVVGMHRTINQAYPELDNEDILICFGVTVGFDEIKPLTASKLAAYIGLPRPTVIRRVVRLVDLGVVEYGPGKSLLAPRHRINGRKAEWMSSRFVNIIQKAAAELSKMDT